MCQVYEYCYSCNMQVYQSYTVLPLSKQWRTCGILLRTCVAEHFLSVCLCTSVAVHPSDHQRMDIIMPGGRHIYLRAASTAERQQWLLALGVAKQEENVIDAGKEGEDIHAGIIYCVTLG